MDKRNFGYKIKSSFILQLKNLDDLEIYYKAKEAGYVIIISKDPDLPAIIDRLGSPPKVINIKAGNASNRLLYLLIRTILNVVFVTQFDLNSIELYLKL